jgi:hypothetical protein
LHLLLARFPPQVSFFLSVSLTDFKFSLSYQDLFIKSEFLEGLLVPCITKLIFDSLNILIFNDKAAFYCVNFNQSFLHVLLYQQLKYTFLISQLFHQKASQAFEELVTLELIQDLDLFGFLIWGVLVLTVSFEQVSR